MARYGFHCGSLWSVPGVNPNLAVPTPQKFGVLQEGHIDLSFSIKGLYGQNVAPVTSGVAQLKIAGGCKFARLRGSVLRDLFFPGMVSETSAQMIIVEGESKTIAAHSVTVSHAAASNVDLGVYFEDGTPLKKVTTPSSSGEYSHASGVYTFVNTTDDGKVVLIDYQYLSTTGKLLTVNNAPAGMFPSFMVVLQVLHNSQPTSLQLFSAQSDKFNFNTKQGDFTIPQFDFQGYADDLGRILAFGGEL